MRTLRVAAASSVLALLTLVQACKTTETPAPAVPAPAEAAPPPAEAPPPEPRVELPPAPALPAAPLGLPDFADSSDNPTTPEKVALGWQLFFDPRLSKDGSMACEACHHIAQAYTSGQALDPKVGGALNKRNAPTMLNLGHHENYYWDGRMPSLEAVSNAAWKGQLGADPATVVSVLNAVPVYKASFLRAFGEPATPQNVSQALAAWLRALRSGNSAYDRFVAGDKKALSKEAQDGLKLFGAKGCVTCHAPPMFSDYDFHNLGIGTDPGRKDASKVDADLGRFKTPSLRNVAQTGPWFHDGHATTLEAAIALMARGGNKNPNLDFNARPQKLSAKEAKALKAFLESLTGEPTFATAPALP